MSENTTCPACNGVCELPGRTEEQPAVCPLCQRVLVPSTSIQAGPPAHRDIAVEELESVRLQPKHGLVGAGFDLVLRLALAAQIAALIAPAAFLAYNDVTVRLGIHLPPRELGRPMNPPREFAMLRDHAILWFKITGWSVLVAFVIWHNFAIRNARLLRSQFPSRAFEVLVDVLCLPAGLFVHMLLRWFQHQANETKIDVVLILLAPTIPFLIVVASLQRIWRASDPDVEQLANSWRENPASWRIRIWVCLCLASPFLLLVAMVGEVFIDAILLLAPIMLAVADMVLISIVRDIARRQELRYARLFGDSGQNENEGTSAET